MAKAPVLTDVSNLANAVSAVAQLAMNNDRVEAAFDNTLSRDGSTPNEMLADIDLNSHRVLNVADPVADTDAVNKRTVKGLVEEFASSIVETAVFGTQVVDNFAPATAGQMSLTLSQGPGQLENVKLFVNGNYLRPGIDFILSGPTLQNVSLSVPLALNDIVSATYTKALPTGITLAEQVTYDDPVSGMTTVQDKLELLPTSSGAAQIGWKQSGADAVLRTTESKLRERVSVKDFGATGDGITNDRPSILKAIAWLEQNADTRGRTLFFPAGTYKINGSLDFTSYSMIHGTYIEGEGDTNTTLNFSGSAPGTDGITFGTGAHFGIKKLLVANAPRHNIVVGRGHTVGGPGYCSFFTIEHVRSQGAGQDGFLFVNAYLGTLKGIWAKANGGNGVNFAGFHTAIQADSCESSENAAAGWALNGLTYATFTSCGADANGTQGWAGSNLQGVALHTCGAESNQRDGFLFYTSSASAVGLNTQSSNIRGVEVVACYALNNSLASAGTYATFVGVNTADSRPASVALRGGVAHPNAAADRAIIVAGVSGAVTLVVDGFDSAAFIGADSITGSAEVQNRLVAGRRCLVQSTAAQSIPDGGADTTITVLNTTPVANDLGATITASTIAVPPGVHKVVVSAGFGWENDGSTGQRTVKVFKNGAGFPGMPSDQRTALSFSTSNVKSAPISVVPGDTFSLVVSQTSGAARNTLGTSNSVWLSVEALS